MNVDLLILEEALRRVSGGTMEAMLEDIVRVANECWAYPGTIWAARRCFLASDRYEAIDGFVRPIRSAAGVAPADPLAAR